MLGLSVERCEQHEHCARDGAPEWGLTMYAARDEVWMLSRRTCRRHNVVKGVALRVERDWSEERAVQLGPRFANEAVWRLVHEHCAAQSGAVDEVLVDVVVDCVDEPVGSWVLLTYALGADVTEINGAVVPPPKEGHARLGGLRSVSTFKPLPRDADGKVGYTHTEVAILRVSPAVRQLLKSKPPHSVRRFLRQYWEQGSKQLDQRMHDSLDLERRMRHSAQSELYQQMCARLGARFS